MTFKTKAAAAIGAFAAISLVSLGVPSVIPASYAVPKQTAFSDHGPVASSHIVFKQGPHGPELSREEAEAKQREKTGTKRPGDDKLIAKANEKIKTREKFQGVRNKAKRDNLKRNPPKVSKPGRRR